MRLEDLAGVEEKLWLVPTDNENRNDYTSTFVQLSSGRPASVAVDVHGERGWIRWRADETYGWSVVSRLSGFNFSSIGRFGEKLTRGDSFRGDNSRSRST